MTLDWQNALWSVREQRWPIKAPDNSILRYDVSWQIGIAHVDADRVLHWQTITTVYDLELATHIAELHNTERSMAYDRDDATRPGSEPETKRVPWRYRDDDA